ncbi:MAG: NTP transferase domain-containing protein [Eubacteriales bacterium]|nr:NTP transferase domain-containing protein [Eubacteriales bacterium]
MKADVAFVLAFQEDAAMNSARHTALHEICFRPLLSYALDLAAQAASGGVKVVTGFDAERVEAYINDRASCVRVSENEDNAAALSLAAQSAGKVEGYALVLSGTAPLIRAETLLKLVEAARGNAASALIPAREGETAENSAERKGECPAYCVDLALLHGAKGSVREFLIAARQNGATVVNVYAPEHECLRVRDRASLWECNYLTNSFLAARHLEAGVTMLDPTKILLGAEVEIGRDTVLYPNVILSGKTKIGENCVLYDGCRLHDTVVGDGCVLQSVVANQTEIGSDVTAGPFVHLRPNTRLGDGCKVGNFVEVKNSIVGEKTKLPHLSYIGDADVGARVNVGCGCVFVNYDGYKKYRTTVGDDVFLGCQTNLVAPVTVGDGAYTAAGSTITDDVPPNAFAIARAYQVNKPDWVAKKRARMRDL